MLSDLPLILVRSLTITLAIETAAAALLGVRSMRGILIVALVNVLTNPLLVLCTFLAQYVTVRTVYCVILFFFEAAAVLAEGLIYRRTVRTKLHPLLLSLILNACSFGAGVAVNALWKI